jgi:hypothetical protein
MLTVYVSHRTNERFVSYYQVKLWAVEPRDGVTVLLPNLHERSNTSYMTPPTRTKVLFLITKSNCGLDKCGVLVQFYSPIYTNVVTRAV